jgi:hypothetical protein
MVSATAGEPYFGASSRLGGDDGVKPANAGDHPLSKPRDSSPKRCLCLVNFIRSLSLTLACYHCPKHLLVTL